MIEEGRALIIALNKWDVAEHASSLFNGVKAALDEGLAQLKDVPLLTVSAQDRQGHRHHPRRSRSTCAKRGARRVPTGELNRWFEAAVEANPPPAPKGQRIKLRYITQVKTPAADLRRVRQPHRRTAGKLPPLSASTRMRRDLKLGAVPLRLDFRGRSNPFDQGSALRQILLFADYPGSWWNHGRIVRHLRSKV